MPVSVAIAGSSGYAGGEVLRLLLDHPEVTVGALTAFTNAGESVLAAHPHLAAHPSLAGRTFTSTSAAELAGHDVVVLALPHGASGAIAAELEAISGATGPLLLDCGADHRLVDPAAWQEYYGSEHAGTWTYGLPELIVADQPDAAITRQRERLTGATRIAVPGCNVTAVTLGMQPGVAAGLVDPTDLVAVLAVGYSGAGKAAKTHLLASEASGSAVPYAVGGSHRHIPEIAQNLTVAGAAGVRISFTPVLVPMSRGILATTTAPLAEGVDPASVRGAWEAFYEDEPFVHVLPEGQWPTSGATTGANSALVQVALDAKAGRVVTVCALDNLVKGTAGAAIQSMNLALGLPETLGLPTTAIAP
ncbi:N-acetyl-gamma-glutamyl-phosphate reductase [Pseudactinotalea suaedae]|uniref:N-acetyl-gamma-glutamyl-phosphate reductase n=1 Tax=Pseudactinotalea suaedae TaxID=1524924 RepID=UPI0019D636F5|nr:N-acetyl-gamma-glutamyl-phosphate reductase [Pseudactinotalea suaedae]